MLLFPIGHETVKVVVAVVGISTLKSFLAKAMVHSTYEKMLSPTSLRCATLFR